MNQEIWEHCAPFMGSQHDRWRLIELLFEGERKAAGLTHAELAVRCGTPYVKPYHLTTLQNLARTIDDRRHQLDRSRVLMALTWGLWLPKWKVDVIMSLFDGAPLTPEETERYLSGYHQRVFGEPPRTEPSEPENFKGQCLAAIGDLLDSWPRPDQGPISATASIYSRRPTRLQASELALLEMEGHPGMRLMVKAGPQYFTDPPPHSSADLSQLGALGSVEELQAIPADDLQICLEIELQRSQLFKKALETDGATTIHSQTTLRQLLRHTDPGVRTLAQRQVATLVSRLAEYDHFHVGLAESTPALEMRAIGLDRAVLRGASGSPFGRAIWGPGVVFWNDPAVVLPFVEDFWENYYSLEPRRRDKAAVIETLCDLADIPQPRGTPARHEHTA